MSGINFVAIDFETATPERASACEIGYTIVENGSIVGSDAWFIQPPMNIYDPMNISIHGIRPRMTAKAPTFAAQWEKLSALLKGKTVVAHYAPFDMGVIRAECNLNELPFPEFKFVCSCALSRFVMPGFYSYGLEPLCQYFGIDSENHHRGKDDSHMTAQLMLRLFEMAEVDSFDALVEKYNYRYGLFEGGTYRPFLHTSAGSSSSLDKFCKEYQSDPTGFKEENPFYDKEVVFTGKMFLPRQDLMKRVMDIGGRTKNTLSKTTDFLVVGQQDFRVVGEDGMSSKQKKAMSMIEAGAPLTLLTEAEFFEMIND